MHTILSVVLFLQWIFLSLSFVKLPEKGRQTFVQLLLNDEIFSAVSEGTIIAGKNMILTYSASKDGWNSAAFHKRVDGFSPSLVVAKIDDSFLVGGKHINILYVRMLDSLLFQLYY